MALYCYIVETGEYDWRESHILGHKNKYSQEEFDDICIEITEKYGDVEEVEHTIPATLEHVEKIVYKIDGFKLLEYLVNEYGFIELNIPENDGHNVKEISRKPPKSENLIMVKIKTPECKLGDTLKLKSIDIPVDNTNLHINGRCRVNQKKKNGLQ